MPIFKLKKRNDDIENGVLIPAEKTSIELEKHLESWLENSPWAIAQEPLLIIGRQTSASQEESETIFPDLLREQAERDRRSFGRSREAQLPIKQAARGGRWSAVPGIRDSTEQVAQATAFPRAGRAGIEGG